jgi:ligand-binding sensor domain-containing protein
MHGSWVGYVSGGLLLMGMLSQAWAGESWRHILHEKQPLLPNNEIHFVKQGAEPGQVWIGTAAGAVELRDGVLRPLATSKGLSVWDVTADRDGGLWVGHDKGALLVKGESTTEALKGSVVVTILPVGDALWALARDPTTDAARLLRLEGDEWRPIEQLQTYRVERLQLGSKGTVWVLLQSNGVLEVDPQKDLAKARHHAPGVSVTSVLTDSTGACWLGTDGSGVMMVSGTGKPQCHLGSMESVVLGLAEDKDNRIWVATNSSGLWVYDGTKWDNLLKGERIELVKASGDGRVWSTDPQGAGLRYWDGQAWQSSLKDCGPLICLAALPDNVLIAGTVFNGLYVLGTDVKGE